MGSEQKLTKQGVRDLNHLTPKRRPVAVEPEKAVAEGLPLVSAPVALAEGVELPLIGK